jgi:hypothetical protein
MKALFNVVVSVLLIQLSACAVNPASEPTSMTIASKEWFNPSFRDIYTTIDVQKVNSNVFVLNYSFSVPVDPQKGVNPSEMHIFTFCVASKLAKQAQRSHWALGSYEKDKDMKYKNTRALTFIVAALEKDEMAPSLVVNSQPIAWNIGPQEADKYFETCSRIIQKKYMWGN